MRTLVGVGRRSYPLALLVRRHLEGDSRASTDAHAAADNRGSRRREEGTYHPQLMALVAARVLALVCAAASTAAPAAPLLLLLLCAVCLLPIGCACGWRAPLLRRAWARACPPPIRESHGT